MRRLGFLALAGLLLVAVPRAAHADGVYFTEAFGGTHVKNELGSFVSSAVNIHVGFGYRHHATSVEGWMGGDMSTSGSSDTTYGDGSYSDGSSAPSPMTYGLDVKQAFRLSPHLEAYVRGSMSRMEVEDGGLSGYGGRGLGVGTGVQLKGKAPLLALLYPPVALVCLIPNVCKKLGPMATVAVYVDQGYDFYRLHNTGRASIDAEATRWRIGFSIGSDF